MIAVIAVAVLLVVLHRNGRLGPLVWEGRPVRQCHPAAVGGGWQHQASRPESAHEVLARRLADGEITPDEYLERQALLQER